MQPEWGTGHSLDLRALCFSMVTGHRPSTLARTRPVAGGLRGGPGTASPPSDELQCAPCHPVCASGPVYATGPVCASFAMSSSSEQAPYTEQTVWLPADSQRHLPPEYGEL